MNAILDADTLLAVDVGSVNTRANLFDVVDGRYRLIATGRSPSTVGTPVYDISEGVRMALDKVQTITGRRLVDEAEELIMPVTNEGTGVDVLVATATAGSKVRTILVGLMPGVSLQSIRRLAASSYLEIVGEIGLMDRRREEERIDLIVGARPDLILMAGGTDGGASDSVLQLVETVGVAANLLPGGKPVRIVFAGNRHLGASVMECFGERLSVTLTPNVRPSLELEDLAPARIRLAEVMADIRTARVSGFSELEQWSRGNFMSTADAFGRIIRYLSGIYGPDKGVLGIDLGASQATIAAAFDGMLRIAVSSDLGLGTSLPGLLKHSTLADVMRWMPVEIPEYRLRDYIGNKALHPGTVPVEMDELHIEYALAREVIRSALSLAKREWPTNKAMRSSWLLPPFEPIIASGGALARAPHPGYAALMLLDAVQPTGISTLVLDPYNLTPALGVAAGPMPVIPVQVLESGSYVSLGTVVAPVGQARHGRRILRLNLEREGNGQDMSGEIRMGQLVVLPLAQGEKTRLTLRPERGIDIGFGGPGRAGALRVAGGAVGLIIDARGRPISLPKDAGQRRELNQKWLWDIGAIE
ncbi:MAG: glutamate mutase L [Anaerolineales bacterium]